MNPSPELNTILKQLRLSGILDSLEQRNREAIDGQLAYTEFLAMLLHDEIARRDTKKLGVRLARAGFAMGKTLETFNFDLVPKLNRTYIHDLATGRYIDEKVCVLLVGGTGVGKSHLAQALGHCAARQGRDVLFISQTDLLKKLHAARATGLYERKFQQFEPPRVCRRPPSLALRRASGAHQIPIVDFLCFRRRYVPERAEQPMVVIPVNPFERGELDVLERTP